MTDSSVISQDGHGILHRFSIVTPTLKSLYETLVLLAYQQYCLSVAHMLALGVP